MIALDRFFGQSPPELRRGEDMLKEGAASFRQGIRYSSGRVFLTSERLIYRPMRFPVLSRLALSPTRTQEIPLSSIREIYHGSAWQRLLGFGRAVLVIRHNQQMITYFGVRPVDEWLLLINELQQHEADSAAAPDTISAP